MTMSVVPLIAVDFCLRCAAEVSLNDLGELLKREIRSCRVVFIYEHIVPAVAISVG
jgi:hypothetical protein